MSYLGNPARDALGHKARQLRTQAASMGETPPHLDKNVGRQAAGREPVRMRRAQAAHKVVRKKGNA